MIKEISKSELTGLEAFDNHEAVFEIEDLAANLHGFIALHRKNNDKPSFGATRFWHYETTRHALADALRLSRGMSYKSALAGLPYGGAKGVILCPRKISASDKEKMLIAYAKLVNELNGAFITGTDVGLYPRHVRLMKQHSGYMVGLKSNPTKFTILGLSAAVKTCLSEVFGSEEISNRTFAIQGLGKIGGGLLKSLYPRARFIFAADINKKVSARRKKQFPKVRFVSAEQIHKKSVDVFSPCALGGSLNARTIAHLKCKMVAGGANNQLESERAGELLHKKGILYAPDYAANAGGLISVVDEYENARYNEKRIRDKVLRISDILAQIFKESKQKNMPTSLLANRMAEKIFNTY